MRGGRLRDVVVIERKTDVQATDGEMVPTWVALMTARAEVKDLRGTELLQGQQAEATMTTRITIRYREGIDARDRVTWKGHVYEVLAISDDPTHAREIEILCRQNDPPRTI